MDEDNPELLEKCRVYQTDVGEGGINEGLQWLCKDCTQHELRRKGTNGGGQIRGGS